MSEYDLCDVLLKWLRTFCAENLEDAEADASNRAAAFDDVTDGVAIGRVLHQIAPEWFSKIWLSKIKTDVGENWRLKVSNLKKIIESVTDYYQEYVNPSVHFVKPDAVKIGEHGDARELAKLLQLILGCAVNCNRKHEYIKQIMLMEESAQNVIMQSIQELESLLGSTPISFNANSLNACQNALLLSEQQQHQPQPQQRQQQEQQQLQVERLMCELHSTSEARDRFAARCDELEMQLNVLLEEKNSMREEKRRLEERVRQLPLLLDDPLSDANARRKQLDALNEKIFKLETSRDDYRLKLEIQEKEMAELQTKFDRLQQAAAEARHLKDEVDILREDADKVQKLEATVESYRKRLEELSELKCHAKKLEDELVQCANRNIELEAELKKANAWKSQTDVYRKQATELRNSLNEATKKLDKAEFENATAAEKLNALQKEKERLIAERDSLREVNEELLCNKLQLKESDDGDDNGGSGAIGVTLHATLDEGESCSSSSTIATAAAAPAATMMSAMELKRELNKLQRENALLKINQKRSAAEDEKLPVLQTMLDDLSQQYKQLQLENRRANQRVIQLEAELKETNEQIQSAAVGGHAAMVRELQSQLQAEKTMRLAESTEKDRLSLELKHVKTVFFETISTKEQEYEELEEKYRKALEKARNVAKSLDLSELQSIGGEHLQILRHKTSSVATATASNATEKDNLLEEMEKQFKHNRAAKEIEEKLLATTFYNFAQRKQHESMDQRLINSSAVTAGNVPYLARQRQSTSIRRLPVSYSSK